MDYEEEIKRLNRLNMKMYMTMNEIINILNERETIILMKNLQNIKKEINFNDDNNNYIKLKNDVDYLMDRQKEREARISKFFTYESSDKECNNGGYEECNNSDCSECQKDKYY